MVPGAGPLVERTPELVHGLVNLIDNAIRHARHRVSLAGRAEAATVKVVISDDGPGFPSELLPHLGEPFLGPSRSYRGGTGLGIFIATTLIERTGGKLAFRNAQAGGAVVEISWPRAYIETTNGEN